LALSGIILGRDGEALGPEPEVAAHLAAVFPGVKLGLEHGPPPTGLRAFDIQGWMARMSGTQYPRWAGMAEGDRFIVSLKLDGAQTIRSIRFAIYGHGVKAARRDLDALAARTGWRLRFG
jgi:hypothetical protein